jgi:hypothetical protein
LKTLESFISFQTPTHKINFMIKIKLANSNIKYFQNFT